MSIAEKLIQIAENEQKVHDAGYTKGVEFGNELGYNNGYNNGYTEGFDAGKQAEYDAFWDTYQGKGKLKVYYMKFHGAAGSISWTNDIYNPKYEIDCTGHNQYGASEVFYASAYITDIKVPINCQGVYMNNTFNGCTSLKRIPLLRVNENTTYRQTFLYCNALEELTIEGTIAQNGLNLQWSTKLSKASIESILSHLDDVYHGEKRSITLSKAAVDKAFETSEGANDGSTSMDWLVWIINVGEDYGQWTISLV